MEVGVLGDPVGTDLGIPSCLKSCLWTSGGHVGTTSSTTGQSAAMSNREALPSLGRPDHIETMRGKVMSNVASQLVLRGHHHRLALREVLPSVALVTVGLSGPRESVLAFHSIHGIHEVGVDYAAFPQVVHGVFAGRVSEPWLEYERRHQGPLAE